MLLCCITDCSDEPNCLSRLKPLVTPSIKCSYPPGASATEVGCVAICIPKERSTISSTSVGLLKNIVSNGRLPNTYIVASATEPSAVKVG